MPKQIADIKRDLVKVIFSDTFHLLFLLFTFLCLILIRLNSGSFAISLGYLYVVLISLSGCWYGVKGGFTAATLSSLIFLLEANYFPDWAFRDMAVRNALLSIFVYFLAGFSTGYYSEVERKLKENLNKMAYYDELTGCVNYGWTMNILEKEFLRCKRYNRQMSLAMLDIDHFKEINDRHGHPVGNDVLKVLANVIKTNLRNIDTVGRYGGDEFLIILPESDSENAVVVLERIRLKLAQIKLAYPLSKTKEAIPINFSAGIASYPYCGEDLKGLIVAVDNALLQVKKTGRNSVAVERRRWIREKPIPGLKIEIVDPHDNSTIKVSDIVNMSKQGMLLIVPRSVVSERYLCKIFFPQGEEPSETPCKIIHKQKIENGLFRVGVYFADSIKFSDDNANSQEPALRQEKPAARFFISFF